MGCRERGNSSAIPWKFACIAEGGSAEVCIVWKKEGALPRAFPG
jgi:hypothetical protein